MRIYRSQIEFENRVEGRDSALVRKIALTGVGLRTHQLMLPVVAGGEIPSRVGRKNVLGITFEQIGGEKKRLPGDAGVAVVVAQREMPLVGVRQGVTEVSGKCAIHKIVVRTLTVGLEVGSSSGIVSAAAARSEIAAFGESVERGNACFPLVREELNHAGDGVTAVNGAFGAPHDFDLINVFRGKTRKIHSAARRINGRSVDEDFGEVRIASVEKDRGATAKRSGARDGDPWGKLQQLGQ